MSQDLAATMRDRSRTAEQSTRRDSGRWLILAFLLPAVAFYLLFLIIPLIGTVGLSFVEWSGFNLADIRFIGLDNYTAALADSVFWQSFGHNLFFLVGAIAFKTVGALCLALMLDQRLPLSNFFRGIYFIPTVMSLVVVGVVFTLVLSPSLGVINPFLRAGGLDSLAGEWLGDPGKVLPIVISIDAWHGFGLYLFIFVARLLSIPQELRDAAAVDGAGELQTIRYVILPSLKSTVIMVVLLAAIASLKIFEVVYVMTRGGPSHGSEVLSTWGYFQAFTANRVGYGNAMLTILLIITFMFAYVYISRLRRLEA